MIGKGRALEARHWRLLLMWGLHGDMWQCAVVHNWWVEGDGKVASGPTN